MKRISVALAAVALIFALAPMAQAVTDKATDKKMDKTMNKAIDKAHMKMVGEVLRVDLESRMFTVKETVKSGTAKEIIFQLAQEGKVMLHSKSATLKDLKVGDSVTVQFREIDGKKIAEECTIARKA